MESISSSSLSCSSSSKRKRSPNSHLNEPYCKKPKNDVFINYSFQDIGNTFIRHFKGALIRNSFTISDHTLLPVGQSICSSLLKSIEESEIFVVVFSGNYASSVRCLDELVYIMDCFRKFDEKRVFPVFFKVEPSDVRSQRGPFMEAFKGYEISEDFETVGKWKQALKDAGQLSGLTFQNGDEAEFLLKIVEELEKMQSPQELYVSEHPVGIGSRAEELILKLRLDYTNEVLVIAVFGISGIGKTTAVKEAYNRVSSQFDVSCFLADIHDLCQVPNWKVVLPNELISCLTRNHKFSIMCNHNDRVTKIRRLVSRQKVLLVLDDVDNFQQLEALGINPAWFYKGSRIIVTTRDKRSLGDIPYASCPTMLLNRRESLNLFTRLMFARDDTANTKFIEQVVSHAGGIPLVLKVWSRHFKQYRREEWASVLETLKRIPHGDVYKQLKLSYDSLTNRAKRVFLDIACICQSTSHSQKDFVVEVLQDEETAFFPNNEIQYLVDKSLVEIKVALPQWSVLFMPRAIREMGHEIVRQENEDDPGQRSRLWGERDVMRVLTECTGTETVESIRLELSSMAEEVSVRVEAFRKMCNLRFIYLDDYFDCISWSNCSADETTPLCFKKLKYMAWDHFPFKSINSISMANVVFLRLQKSKLEILWNGIKSLKKLRILDVSHSMNLTRTGDFYGLENLEQLDFGSCPKLEKVHRSIGRLHKLKLLKLHNCFMLKMIPWEMIGKLQSVVELKLTSRSGCREVTGDSLLQLHQLTLLSLQGYTIQWFPNIPRNIKHIEAHECTSLLNFPTSISDLKSLAFLSFRNCPKLGSEDPQVLMKITGLTNLRYISLRGCGVSEVPTGIGNLVSLRNLDLSENTFSSLPDSLSNLSQLYALNINDCSKLLLLPLLPSNLRGIEAYGCGSLDIMPFDSVLSTYIFRTKLCKDLPLSKRLVICLPPKEIPDWCSYRNRGRVFSAMAPMYLDKKIRGIIIVTSTKFPRRLMTGVTPKMLNKTKGTSYHLKEEECIGDSIIVMFYPLDDTTFVVEAGDTVALEFPPKSVSRCGLRLIYDTDVADSKLVFQNIPVYDTNEDYDDSDSSHGSNSDYDSDSDTDSDSDETGWTPC